MRRPHTSAQGPPALAAAKTNPAAADMHSTKEPREGMWVRGEWWPGNIKKNKGVFYSFPVPVTILTEPRLSALSGLREWGTPRLG